MQGVFFRAKTKRQANINGIKGWVLNRNDGKVEAVFEGEELDVKNMVEFCKHGPPGAQVTKIDLTWEDYTGEFKEFEIKY